MDIVYLTPALQWLAPALEPPALSLFTSAPQPFVQRSPQALPCIANPLASAD